ncbi:MAG TPA: efflux RND transporter periplasmic adaptor subunit [Spirochaetota bacterium]|nr:efflux RND transporter periplasmic adaptor subunit [Spirochaetota bacterium]
MWRFGKKQIGITIAVIALLIIIIVKGCGGKGEKIYVYDKAVKTDVLRTITVTGELEVMDPVTIMCKSTGIVEGIYTDFNQYVSKGQLLMKLDSIGIEQKVMKAASLIEGSRLEVESAQRELEGKKNLYKDNLISKRAMEQAEIEYNIVVSRYKQVKIDYDMAVKEREYTRIYSPISGVVIAVYKKKDEPVSVSVPLILLAPSLKRMTLTINIDESDIGNIKNGQQVVFSVSAFPDKKFYGSISQVRINPVKTGGLVTYQAIVVCDNEETMLKPGMTVTATVIIDERKGVIAVSNQAFMVNPDGSEAKGNEKFLWKRDGVLGSQSYKRITVKTGLTGDIFTEITEGVKEAEEIMTKIKESK